MKQFLIILFFAGLSGTVFAQDDLMKMLDSDSTKHSATVYTTATFKTTRLINGHSVENLAAGVLDVKFSHRFGFVNTGAYELFGLDNATTRMGADYGITNRLMVGIGRSSYQKQFDGFYKFKILRQSTGYRNMPVTLSIMSSLMITTLKWADPTRKNYFSSRIAYAHQVLVGRKFSEGLSLQLMPSFVHYNMVTAATDPNDVFALGAGGRIKLNKRVSFNVEYYYVLPVSLKAGEDYRLSGTHNSLAMGFDIETGGHVFQLHFTNSTGMTEKTFISETAGQFFKGDIHFGFNIARVFTINDPRKKKKNVKM
jgi:hypothetical protein